MISINGTELSKITIGDTEVLYVYRGDELIYESVKRYGGLTVYRDDVMYTITSGNGYIEEWTNDEDFFTIIIDTGTTTTKRVEFGYTQAKSDKEASMRIFNRLQSKSVDYWTVKRGESRTLNLTGRYYVFSVAKVDASYFFVRDANNGKYFVKGKQV